MKLKRNKTIEILEEEKNLLISRLLKGNMYDDLETILDKTINIDCFKVSLPYQFADLIFLDPPYNLNKKFNQDNKFNKISDDEYKIFVRNIILNLVWSYLKPDGSLYFCGDYNTSPIISTVLKEQGFTIKNRITWEREKGRGAKSNWKNCSEDIWFAVKDTSNYTFNVDNIKLKKCVIAPYKENGVPKDWKTENKTKYRLTSPSNLWTDLTVPFWSMSENTKHTTQKPEKLLAKIILASSNKGDVVFDPFLGSGTTSVVAKKLGRNYVGIEKDEYFCMVAEKRLKMVEKSKRIQGYEDNVFYERNYKNGS